MEYVETAGLRIPKLGLGTWKNTGPECSETVEAALEAGYRHIDTAQAYDNERAVGRGITTADLDRDDIFLTTKVWRSNLRYDDVLDSVHESLDNLSVDYVDLLLMHWPHPRVPLEETLEALLELYAEGVVKGIGVSNFTQSQLEKAMNISEIPIVANQVLYHPYKDQSELQQYCAANEIALTAYSPLARGDVLSEEMLTRIGQRYDKNAAQVALRWLIQQDGVVAIPKTSTQSHLEQNLRVFDFTLTETEMTQIADCRGPLAVQLRNRLPSIVRHLPI
jgi:diketogulonate reductase-like aldo/keto reductase